MDPPSVAAAMDGVMLEDDPDAVWYELIDRAESVGVGACAPVARGCEVRSSDPLGLGAGRMVIMEDREEEVGSAL